VDQRTKRIFKKTIINLSKLFAFATSFVIYMIACFWMSYQSTGDIFIGLAACFIPMIVYAVWDQSKAQVEHELWKEERTIQTLSRKYE